MQNILHRAARAVVPLLFGFMLTACGGGGGASYAITVSTSSVQLSGLINGNPPVQNVNVTFKGDGVVVATLPGQPNPSSWLSVRTVSSTATSAVIEISGSTFAAAGNYSTTLRFATGKADGSEVVYKDVAVSYQLQQGMKIIANLKGLATGNAVSAALEGEAAVPLSSDIAQQNWLGTVVVGGNYNVSIPAQPTGQHCTFDNGGTSISGTMGSMLLTLRISCNAALLPWTWVGGSQTIGDAPVHGVRGTAAAGNTPGGRVGAAHARDAAGNLWVFGGIDANGWYNDLWRYDINAKQWTWVSGSTAPNAVGNYGTRDVAAPTNVPGARNNGVAWFDAAGDFWIFGGHGYTTQAGVTQSLNDLWKYSVAGDTWTWVGGSNSTNVLDHLGVYGTTPSTSNIPGFRSYMAVVRDAAGAIWLYGGYGAGSANSFGPMNDLWKFDPATRIWSWVSGSDLPNGTRVQGTLGVPDPANNPGARSGVAVWAEGGNLWLLGGTNPILGFENDLWRYNTTSGVWTWMGGTNRTNPATAPAIPVYHPPGTTTTDYPASRGFASTWTDAAGNLWLFGGNGQGPTINSGGNLNDLWKYSPATNAWSWLSGSNDPGLPSVYGTQGVAANTNVPAARTSGVSWIDASGRLWLWGGSIGPNSNEGGSDVWYATPP